MQQQTLAFPKPGPALKGLLATVAAMGIGLALLGDSELGTGIFYALVCVPGAIGDFQIWRLVTSGVLTSSASYGHLIFSLMGLYFLSCDLERRWGGRRMLTFMASAVIVGNLLAIGVDAVVPTTWGTFRVTRPMFGPEAAIVATAIAWSRANADRHILLFFVIPVRGKYVSWLAIGFCMLGLIYSGGSPAGHVAPFGGVLAGFFLGSSPSPLRNVFLRLRLWSLRRRLGGAAPPSVESIARGGSKRKAGGPPLRVVQGGQDDKKPPKDKRYLN